MSSPEISVVMITCDRAEQVFRATASLLAQVIDPAWSFEIVVVDDGSQDGTMERLRPLIAAAKVPVRLVRTAGVGVPAARNAGAAAAQGRWIATFDDDQIASVTWLHELRLGAEESGARCLGGALELRLPVGETPQIGQRARNTLGEQLLGDALRAYPRKWLPATNNSLMERGLFERMGGFDVAFTQGGSDTDLFTRVRDAGEAIWFAPRAVAEHVISQRRLTRDSFRWINMKVGATDARICLKRTKWAGAAGFVAMRAAVAFLRDSPALAWGMLRGDAARQLESQCSLWYSVGLARFLLAQMKPGLLGGGRFMDSIDFRMRGGERTPAV